MAAAPRGDGAAAAACGDEEGLCDDQGEELGGVGVGGDGSAQGGLVADAAGDSGDALPSDLPELLDLIDAVEEASDTAELVAVIRKIGLRLRATPSDRDLLSDFEGIAHICRALAGPPHHWQGDAMLAFCRVMPEVCRTSVVNRGSLRDEGFLAACVELLRSATSAGDEASASAACAAVAAMCTANDGNKKAAAEVGAETVSAGDSETAGKSDGLSLLLLALKRFADSAPVQTEGVSALVALLTDDDPRTRGDPSSSAARENRELATGDEGFPYFGAVVERALAVADESKRPQIKLREQTLLLLREISRRHDRVEVLAVGAKLLPRVTACITVEDPRVVRASLAVLRNFAVVEEVRDEIAMLSDVAQTCIGVVRKHVTTPAVCEQGFGLFANLTMRKSPIAAKLNEGEQGIVALGLLVIRQHKSRPDVMRSVVHTLRNSATQDDAICQEVKESDIFEEVRKLVKEHEGDARWKAPVDIARQFLREFRADEGMEKKAQYNDFY